MSYSLAIEIFSPKFRTFAGVIMEIFWAAGIVLLGFAAYFIKHWRYIQLAVSLPSLVTILYIW